MEEGFRTFDHTGDLGLEVWAETPERLFALSAEALLAQVAEVPAEAPVVAVAPDLGSATGAAAIGEGAAAGGHAFGAPAGSTAPAAEERVRVALAGDDAPDLFVHWLNTALLEAEVRRRVWTRVTVTSWSPTGLVAWLEGPTLDPRRHTLLREVKAVSHHYLELDLSAPACRARMVLDL